MRDPAGGAAPAVEVAGSVGDALSAVEVAGSGDGAVLSDDGVGGGDEVVDDGVGGGDEVVDDGVGGMLVEGLCGWPGPLCPSNEDVEPIEEGGRLWFSWERSKWTPWVGRVLDLCDDHEALAAIRGESAPGFDFGIDYDAAISSYDLQRIEEDRHFRVVVCSDTEAATPRWRCLSGDIAVLREYLLQFAQPPESSEVLAWVEARGLECQDAAALRRRYVYVTFDGPLWPEASVEAAAEAGRRLIADRSDASSDFARDAPLGFWGWNPPVESPADQLVVLAETVSVTGGAVRGLAQNRSERLWARGATVTATDSAGRKHMWRFPLTVQPGEVMPFEFEGWAGPQSPSEIGFEATADLSPTIDLTRSLELYWKRTWGDKRLFSTLFGPKAAAAEPPDSDFPYIAVDISRAAPVAHPRLAEAALTQTIDNLRVYGAVECGGVVTDVFELSPGLNVSPTLYPVEWVEVSSIPPPTTASLEDVWGAGYVTVAVIGETMVWAGGAAEPRAAANP